MTGRWRGIPKDDRICKLRELYSNIISTNILDDNVRFRHLSSEDFVPKTSKLVRHLYDERKRILYKE